VISTALASSFRLQYFTFYVRYSKDSCLFLFLSEILVLVCCGFQAAFLCMILSKIGVLCMIMSGLFGCWCR
jgi:hypothetical protein